MIVNPSRDKWAGLITRPELDQKDLSKIISSVYDSIALDGDAALKKYTKMYDGVEVEDLEVKTHGVAIDSDLADAIDVASRNIHKFHSSQKTIPVFTETSPGVVCWQESRALESVGLYIPGGTAPLFSTVLMLAIPAKIAGCKEIILCTPPQKDGTIHPAILYAAKVSGIQKVFSAGGSQAIAAMCIGTETIPRVQKIFGPGNQYVTAAKVHASILGTPIDMPAGPSELLVIASENCIPSFVAADLLSQAEHGIDSQVICLSQSAEKIASIKDEILNQLEVLPRRDIASKAIDNSKFIVFEDQNEMINFTNLYAPEHLIIADDNFESYISKIINAGSVFLGNYCPESAGDYASGTNHTLPTSGNARTYSGVNLDAFVKKITFQKISKKGIVNLGKTIEVMAEAEGLQAHKNAVTIRLKKISAEE